VTAAPVISEFVSSPQLGGQPIQLLGIDPFAEPPFRSYLGGPLQNGADQPQAGGDLAAIEQPASFDLTAFLVQPGAVLISTDLAQRFRLQPCSQEENAGCQITLQIGGQARPARIAGLLQPADRLSRRALDGLILADIATAQELTGRLGVIDRIDLILAEECNPAGAMCSEELAAWLPDDVLLQPVSARSGAIEQMTSAFRINLTALSLLALVVGMFLIYNTMTFSVVQRRPLFGTLRCLGATQGEVFGLVMLEATLVGAIGAFLGVGLGVLLGQGAVRLVTQTVNDLFFVVSVRGVQIPPFSLLKGALLGIAATLLTAGPPAWEAAHVPPRVALSRSGLESKAQQAIRLSAIGGGILILAGVATLLIPTRNLVVSFAGTFSIVVGAAMLVPLLTGYLMKLAIPPLGRAFGTLGRMAPRGVVSSLSRTSIAVMALMVAVSVTIGVSLMVSSFRNTVQTWLNETLQGDIYISVPGLTATTPSTAIQPEIIEAVRSTPGVQRADVLRSVEVDSPNGKIDIAATDNLDSAKERVFLHLDGDPENAWQTLIEGSVLVSEPLANRLDLPHQGGTLRLITDSGERAFPVAGIYYDYASSQGTVLMPLSLYQDNWDDNAITAIALRLAQGVEVDTKVQELQQALAGQQGLLIRPNRELRADVLEVFDRTFAITNALQLLATLVAFIGVLSALLSLELERQRELGILRAVGMTVRQIWSLVFLETGLLGLVAGLLAMPTGYMLAIILIYIINRRSFGWTLQMELDWLPFSQALLVAVLAALLAGVYPAYRMGRMITSEALRSE
jgi:putative ABC transport system permease protein